MAKKIQVDNQEFAVRFRYEYDQQHKPVSSTCLLFNGEEQVGEGSAKVYYRDTFTYKKGRKWSLRRAMANAGLDKATRTEIWEAMIPYIA